MINFSSIDSDSLAGKALRFPLRMIPDNAVVPILQGPLQGKKWITGSANHGCWLGSFEFDKQKNFLNGLGVGDVVYDVGANVGYYTLLSSERVGPSGQICAFEPLPRNLYYLRRHLELNDISNAEIFASALAESNGSAAFHVGATPAQGHISDEGGLHVQTVTLDETVREADLPLPDVVKIDIEGTEFEMLKGAQATLQKARPTIFLATHGDQVRSRCLDLLTSWGFEVTPVRARVNSHDANEFIAVHS